ncbi:MAG: hypothetical protein ABJC60_04335 [Actinomycetota bacterium]
MLGAVGGLLYLAARDWVPARWRPGVTGVMMGAIGGALVIKPGGVDFNLLEPLPLALALFVAMPAGYGVVLSVLIERRLAADPHPSGWTLWLPCVLFGVVLALVGQFGAVILTGLLIAWILHRRVPNLDALRTSGPVVWVGRALLTAATAFGLVKLVRDVSDVL